MFKLLASALLSLLGLGLCACTGETPSAPAQEEAAAEEVPSGPHNGRLLREDDFTLELAIFESGVPPEFRAWPSFEGKPVPPGEVDLSVTLTRLDSRDVIGFDPREDYLRGDTTVHEPHSFLVRVDARHRGREYQWDYESLEGRTTLSPTMSETLGVETEIAGPAELGERLRVVGRVRQNADYVRRIYARFEGLVQAVEVNLGERVEANDTLLRIESNESLNAYVIEAPISGVVTQRNVSAGEQTGGRLLLELMDDSRVWAELAIPLSQRGLVERGDPVIVTSPLNGVMAEGRIDSLDLSVSQSQTLTARVLLDNGAGAFPPGSFVEASILTAEIEVPLAVRRAGLQPFRDFTVVYAKIGDTYEVRMLELGRQDDEWVEVLGGLTPGTEYVSRNSYVLKADVEKSGATHDH